MAEQRIGRLKPLRVKLAKQRSIREEPKSSSPAYLEPENKALEIKRRGKILKETKKTISSH